MLSKMMVCVEVNMDAMSEISLKFKLEYHYLKSRPNALFGFFRLPCLLDATPFQQHILTSVFGIQILDGELIIFINLLRPSRCIAKPENSSAQKRSFAKVDLWAMLIGQMAGREINLAISQPLISIINQNYKFSNEIRVMPIWASRLMNTMSVH